MYILITGNPVDGFHFVGPFLEINDANEHAEIFYKNNEWWIAHLKKPEED